ncbi:MAG: hypothetical protein H7Y14_10765 [Burkholderiales bacterium]|nr:hypothetical protein [Burkholderiales bacterium]
MTQIEHDSGKPVATQMAHILYVMHAISPFTLWTLSLIAVIMGAFTRDSVRGTWVETHYSYLLRTFIWGIFWLVATTIVFTITVIGIFLLWVPWGILTIWYLYRVIRGWLRLNDNRPAPD